MKPFFLSVLFMAFGALLGTTAAQSCDIEAIASLQTELWGQEVSFTISDDNGILAEGQGLADYALQETTFCLDSISGCLTLEMFDSFGDGWNGAFLEVSIPALGLSLGGFTLETGDYQAFSFGEGCDQEVIEVEGCTDPSAFNYDPFATIDDGSCSYDCECEDIYDPVCAYDFQTGNYITYNNLCEAECAQAWVFWEGDCADQPIYGCTDEEAINYNPDATDDDGSCVIVPECGENEMQVVATLQTDIWGGEVSYTISDANGVILTGQGLGDYGTFDGYFCLGDSAGCLTLEMFDSFGDSWNGAVLDIYAPELGLSLGTFTLEVGAYQAVTFGIDCETEVIEVEGCTDPFAFNYNPFATIDDGSCSYDCECEDIYDPVCAYDYQTGNYITYNNLCEAECAQAWVFWEGDCSEQPIYGCTDEEAINYNPDATDDDGSCVIVPECGENEMQVVATLQTDIWGGEVSFSISNNTGVLLNGEGLGDYATYLSYDCLEDSAGCLVLEMFDSFGDGWNGAYLDVSIPSLGLSLGTFTLETGSYQAISFGVDCETEIVEVEGCTNPFASNYDPYATVDDGSCSYDCECDDVYEPVCAYDYFTGDYVTFNNACEAECWNAWVVWNGDCADQPIYGCTNPEALNYNPEATEDDGSCAVIPVCGENQTELLIQTAGNDSLNDLGIFVSLYWNLTTDLGQYVELVYDYNEAGTTAYGCLNDGCYNFYLYDYGWTPGLGSADVSLNGEVTSYSVGADQFDAVFALGVNTDGCEVTIPGCTDPEALNYYASATVDDGSCQYPFVCDNGEVGYVYLSTSLAAVNLDIVSENGDLVYSEQDAFNFGGLYGEICIEPNTCYTAVVTGDMSGGNGWNDGVFGVSTSFLDLVYSEWPGEGDSWVVQFSLDGACGEDTSDDIYGCTDPEAMNFDPTALLDDGSCEYETLCPGMFEVTFVLDGGAMPDEVNLNVSNEDGDILMEMDGYTGSSTGCVPAGCYRVEMMDDLGDGWNGAFAEVFVDGESAGTMTLEEGDYEMEMVGLGVEDCETPDNTDDVHEAGILGLSLDLFPNPGQDVLNIRTSGCQTQTPVALNVFNAEGRLVHTMAQGVQSNLETLIVDASAWDAGFYIIQLNQGTSMVQQRWVKLK